MLFALVVLVAAFTQGNILALVAAIGLAIAIVALIVSVQTLKL